MATITDGAGQIFERLNCGECGINFYAPQDWVVRRRDHGEHGREFNCPNGHSRVWRESALDKMRRERDQLKQDQARYEEWLAEERRRVVVAERQTAAFKGVATKLKKRAIGGTCPCCNRSFSALAKHIATKHPDFKSADIIPLSAAS